MEEFNTVYFLIRIPVILLALTVHEFCHAYFALRMGDPTAYRLGRCTLNPLKHLDPLGTICLLFAPIGWAKPVPINPDNFANPRRGNLVATAAGPLSNVVQAFLFALALRGMTYLPDMNQRATDFAAIAAQMAVLGIMINVGLAVFNCLPFFPLDGFHIMSQLVSPRSQDRFLDTARFGPFLILGLVMLNNYSDVRLLSDLISPVTLFFLKSVAGLG